MPPVPHFLPAAFYNLGLHETNGQFKARLHLRFRNVSPLCVYIHIYTYPFIHTYIYTYIHMYTYTYDFREKALRVRFLSRRPRWPCTSTTCTSTTRMSTTCISTTCMSTTRYGIKATLLMIGALWGGYDQ